MNRKSVRRPSPASVVAAAGLVLAATPIADAATGKAKAKPTPPVAHARFADNASKINNYKASIHPTPNTLLPLGPDGRYPASVLPTTTGSGGAAQGPAGPRGPAGPAGANGLNSPGVVAEVFRANGTVNAPLVDAAVEAPCKPGMKVLGGGFSDLTRTVPALSDALPPGSVDEVVESEPFVNADGTSGWRVRIVNVPPAGGTPGATFFQAYAICGG